MRQFMALLRLELSQWKINFSQVSGIGRQADKKALRSLGIMAVVVFLAVYMVFMELKVMDVLQALQCPEVLPEMLVMISMMLTLMLGLFQVISNLYFSRDILILGYLPVNSPLVYAGRLGGQLVEEIVISLLFIVPGTVVYFTRVGFDAAMLARALAVTLVAPVMPLSVGALLAGLLTKIPGFWKHRETVTTIFSIAIMLLSITVGFLVGQMQGSAVEEKNIQNTVMMLRERFSGITGGIPPIRWCARGLTRGGPDLILAVAVSAASLALVCLLFGRSYLKVASHALETSGVGRKVDMKTEKLRAGSARSALLQREIREMLRTPAYLTNGLLTSLLMPTFIVGVMLFSLANAMEGGLNFLAERSNGTGEFEVLIAGILTLIMGLFLGLNSAASTAVSREGKRHALLRSLPVSTHAIMMSKLKMSLYFQWMGVLPAVILSAVLLRGFGLYALLVLLWCALLGFIGTCMGLAVDVTRPRLDWLNETQAIKSGFNQVIGMLVTMAMVALTALLTYLAMEKLKATPVVLVLVVTGLLAVFSLLAWLILRKSEKNYDRISD